MTVDYNDFDEACGNCGGDGYYYDCFEEYACIDPEGGCDLCMHRCDWCNRPEPTKDETALKSVLSDALGASPAQEN